MSDAIAPCSSFTSSWSRIMGWTGCITLFRRSTTGPTRPSHVVRFLMPRQNLPEGATWWCGAVVVENCSIGPIVDGDRRRARGAVMAPYVKPTRPEPTSEEFLALLGPLVYVARWLWRRLRELARGWAHLAAA